MSFILVYSLDRFSRTGGNAIFISSELKRNGASILSVAQQIDTESHSGKLQESIHFIFSQYNNDLRFVEQIFLLKASNTLSNTEISRQMATTGFNVSNKLQTQITSQESD